VTKIGIYAGVFYQDMAVEILLAHGDMRDQHRDPLRIGADTGVQSRTTKTHVENQELNFIPSDDTHTEDLKTNSVLYTIPFLMTPSPRKWLH